MLFYLSSSVDYLRPGEGIYIGSLDTETTTDTKASYVMPKILAPVAQIGDDPQLGALYVPKGRALWATLQLAGPTNTSDTPIVGAQGGYY